MREFRAADGRRWRVWEVRPNVEGGERRGRLDRRVTPVEALEDPPVLQRRRGDDRRTQAASRSTVRPGDLLPDRWRDGWLVFDEEGPDPGPAQRETRETRRLAPIPTGWEGWSEAELAAHLARATPGRRWSV